MSQRFDSIPVFDLEKFTQATGESKDRLVFELREICHNIGFFYVSNSGVSPKLMKQVLELTRSFFDLPQEEKDSISISQSPHYRGYGKLQAEMTLGIPDFKETYDLGLEHAARQSDPKRAYLQLQGPNQWPHSLSKTKFRETVLTYLSEMQKLGGKVMEALSLVLELPESYFNQYFDPKSDDAYSILRLLRYPPARLKEGSDQLQLGVGPHIDSGCLVFLLQDETGGLQVQNCDGEWIDAPPIDSTFVVNFGKMLQIWSNDFLLATPHRVINQSQKIRYSAPFFLEPSLSTEVMPVGAVSKRGTIYGEFMLEVYRRSFPLQRTVPHSTAEK